MGLSSSHESCKPNDISCSADRISRKTLADVDFKSCKALANVTLADTSKANLDIEK